MVELKQPIEATVRSNEDVLIEMTPTIVQADVGGTPSQSLFPTEKTESIHAVIEIHIYDRFTELDRTLYDCGSIVW